MNNFLIILKPVGWLVNGKTKFSARSSELGVCELQ